MKPEGMAGRGRMGAWLVRIADRTSLRVQVGVLAVLLTLAAASATTTVLQNLAVDSAQRAALTDLRQSALHVQGAIARSIDAHLADLRIAATAADDMLEADGAVPHRWLAELQSAVPSLEWVGFADARGRVLSSSDHSGEGASVAERPWFAEGAKRAYVGSASGADPFRLVELGVPVRSADGRLLGVLGARIGWTWASRLADALAGGHALGTAGPDPFSGASDGVRIVVADGAGRVLIGSRYGTNLRGLRALDVARNEGAAVTRELVPGIGDALVTALRPANGGPWATLPWTVLAVEPTWIAFGPAEALKRAMFGWGALIALFAGLVASSLAKLLTRPLIELTHTAQALGETDDVVTLPRLVGSREMVAMSQALRSLLRRLGGYEFRLREVADRNAKLARVMAAVDADMADLRRLANTDPLTGLLNRRAFTERADTEFAAARRYGRELAVVALDIDHFKLVNDVHGHATGDEVIRQVAEVCRASTRSTDAVGRLGGEEFVVLLIETTESAALACAERLRTAVEAMRVGTAEGAIRVTVSAGVAVLDGEHTLAQLLDRADRALYAAKRGGRNRVTAEAEPALALPAA